MNKSKLIHYAELTKRVFSPQVNGENQDSDLVDDVFGYEIKDWVNIIEKVNAVLGKDGAMMIDENTLILPPEDKKG